MSNGLFPTPPTDGPSMPDIPVANFKSVGAQIGAGIAQAGLWDDLVNKLWHALWDAISWSVSFLVSGLDEVLALMTKLLTAMQGMNTPGYFAMIASVLSDTLGVEFSADAIAASFNKRGTVAAMTTIGGDIYDTLAREFTGGVQNNQLVPSTAPAKAFLGFLTSFAIRQGNVATITGLLPEEVNFLSGLREYGELLARNLGLGRLARQALRPLMQVLVSDPLNWSLNQQYRPKLLNPDQAINAYQRGYLSQEDLNTVMAREGYSDGTISMLLSNATKLIDPSLALQMVRLGTYTEDQAVSQLQYDGYPVSLVQAVWNAEKAKAEAPLLHTYLTELRQQVRNGIIQYQDALNELDTYPLTASERAWWARIMFPMGHTSSRHLSEAEIERAFLRGITDMTTTQLTWQRLGYTPEAIQTLTLLLLDKASTGTSTRIAHVTHKTLSEAQIMTAYESGIIDLSQAQAAWANLGYSPQSIAALTLLATAKTPGPGTTQLPGWTGS